MARIQGSIASLCKSVPVSVKTSVLEGALASSWKAAVESGGDEDSKAVKAYRKLSKELRPILDEARAQK